MSEKRAWELERRKKVLERQLADLEHRISLCSPGSHAHTVLRRTADTKRRYIRDLEAAIDDAQEGT